LQWSDARRRQHQVLPRRAGASALVTVVIGGLLVAGYVRMVPLGALLVPLTFF